MTVQQGYALELVTEALHVRREGEDSVIAPSLVAEVVRTAPQEAILYLAAWTACLLDAHATDLGREPLEMLQGSRSSTLGGFRSSAVTRCALCAGRRPRRSTGSPCHQGTTARAPDGERDRGCTACAPRDGSPLGIRGNRPAHANRWGCEVRT